MSASEYRTGFIRSVGAALLLATVPSGGLFAQTPINAQPGTWLIGASLGVPGVDASHLESELFTVGVHATRVEPGRLGGDFAVGTMPRILIEGVLPLGARAGLALPLALSENVLLVPSGGASLIAALGTDGSAADAGLNVGGVAMVLSEGYGGFAPASRGTGFRTAAVRSGCWSSASCVPDDATVDDAVRGAGPRASIGDDVEITAAALYSACDVP